MEIKSIEQELRDAWANFDQKYLMTIDFDTQNGFSVICHHVAGSPVDFETAVWQLPDLWRDIAKRHKRFIMRKPKSDGDDLVILFGEE